MVHHLLWLQSNVHLLNVSPQCPLNLDLEVNVDLGSYFCQLSCIIQAIHMPHFLVQCNKLLFHMQSESSHLNWTPQGTCSYTKFSFLDTLSNYLCYWRLCDLWSSCRKPVDLSWAKHEMQSQECSEFRELPVKKGLTQKNTTIPALIHVSSSSQLIGSSVTVINTIKTIFTLSILLNFQTS